MITDKTRNVLIESAWRDPVTVRKSSRRHGLHTDVRTSLSVGRISVHGCVMRSGGSADSGFWRGVLVGDAIDVVSTRLDQRRRRRGFRGGAHPGGESGTGRFSAS